MLKTLNAIRKLVAREGIRQAVRRLRMTNGIEFRLGVLKGEDGQGNKYYEKTDAQIHRDRWVEYRDTAGFDASVVPANWHPWLHHITAEIPAEDKRMPAPKYAIEGKKMFMSAYGVGANYLPQHHYLRGKSVSQRVKYGAWRGSTA